MEPCPPSRRCWRRVPSPSSWPPTLDDPTAPSSRSTPWRQWPRSWRRSWASQWRTQGRVRKLVGNPFISTASANPAAPAARRIKIE
ncbi:unnamed protein product [Symbiodinium necroappetens]|uniref:Uncharacterized protein n=1 Tax=Symbiodinium necroappetens TaxID=1628268 RepID=A0A813AA67_9DINO|nr:unnamed protein product [Symbiodinium necroappetens]